MSLRGECHVPLGPAEVTDVPWMESICLVYEKIVSAGMWFHRCCVADALSTLLFDSLATLAADLLLA